MSRRVIAYARVSTKTEEQETSLPRQIEICEEKAEEEGWEVVGTTKEQVSGLKVHPLKREGFPVKMDVNGMSIDLRFHDGFKETDFDTILVKKPDRFSRNPEHKKPALRLLGNIGIEVLSVEDEIVSDDTMKNAMLDIRTHLVKDKIEKRNKNIKETLKKKKEKGEPVGKPPTGMRYNEDKNGFVPLKNPANTNKEDPLLWEDVEEIFKRYVKEDESAYSIGQDKRFSTTTVYRMLKPKYGRLKHYLEHLPYNKDELDGD